MGLNRVFLVCHAMTLAIAASSIGSAAEVVPLEQAVRDKSVSVYVSSLGGSTGNTVSVNVKRLVGRPIRVVVTPGTIFRPAEVDAQSMAAASVQGIFAGGQWQKADAIVLDDDRPRDYLLEAYCIDYDKPAPSYGDQFVLDTRNDRVRSVLDAAARRAATSVDVQVAIWMDRQRAKGVEIAVDGLKRRFPAATDQSILAARRLLVDVRTGAGQGGRRANAAGPRSERSRRGGPKRGRRR